MSDSASNRNIGLTRATFIGIAAIVGGGIFVLGGVAIKASGPGAILAFALNGFIAFLTALSFAEMSSAFPQSGGPYTYAKRILSVRAAFLMGWILILAHIVACLLYALGFAAYTQAAMIDIVQTRLHYVLPDFFKTHQMLVVMASLPTLFYTTTLIRSPMGQGNNANYIKLVIFCSLIVFGIVSLLSNADPISFTTNRLTPFFPFGMSGVFAAMGFTFIALQGFDLVAAVAGEIKTPERTIPRAMLFSLSIALLIYIPMLFIAMTAGVNEGQTAVSLCELSPETCFADAARVYMGEWGYWLVIIAAIFSTLSALSANILASSRVIQSMSNDRTLPRTFAKNHPRFLTPHNALIVVMIVIVVLLCVIPDTASAGAAASLVFLICYAFSNLTSIVARKRGAIGLNSFRTPLFPAVQTVGGLSCIGLAIFQMIVVPSAGAIVLAWLVLGFLLYFWVFSARAEALDAYMQGLNPDYLKSRGKKPFVLVPITNPKNAGVLLDIAQKLASPTTGKVLLLQVVKKDTKTTNQLLAEELQNANQVLKEALLVGINENSKTPEALLTIAADPLIDISRVASSHHCETVVLGFDTKMEPSKVSAIDKLISQLNCNVALLSNPKQCQINTLERVLVPISGRGGHDALRARVLGSLIAGGVKEITLLKILPKNSTRQEIQDQEKSLTIRAQDEARGFARTKVVLSNNAIEGIIEEANSHDIILLGMSKLARSQLGLGAMSIKIAAEVACPTLIIGRAHS